MFMNWLEKMNNAIDYIEDNLDKNIDYDILSQKACCSKYNFQRMFSFIADITLSEYIRRRRLTLASIELQNGSSVLDVAIKYGYNSPTSFARAFYSVHGIQPNEAKKIGAKLKLYPKIAFKIIIKGVSEMNYRIENVESFRLIGNLKSVSTINNENYGTISKMWNDFCMSGDFHGMIKLSSEPNWYGVCCNFRKDEFDYMIGIKSNEENIGNYSELIVPSGMYVKFEVRGKMPDAQHKTWRRIFTEWFPNTNYKERMNAPEIEWYSVGNMSSDDYLSEIWIPIEK